MGIYLYGIKKLKKAQRVVREDGEVATVNHCLSYVSKPYWGWQGIEDRYSKLAIGRIHRAYGDKFTGYVLFGESILYWNSAPTWLDGDDFPKHTGRWGVATDLKEVSSRSEDDHLATVSRARLPTLRVQDGTVLRTMEGRAVVCDPHTKYLLDSRHTYAVRLPNHAVELRGGPHIVRLNPLVSDAEIMAELHAYTQVVQDWLVENTPIPAPAPKPAPLPPPPPSHEDMMRAAGWI